VSESTAAAGHKRTRVRGFAPWEPRAESRAVLEQAQAIIAEYEPQWPLTLRQVFYALVGRHGFDKTEQAYERLGNYLNRARRAELVPFDAIRDGQTTAIEPLAFTSRAHFIEVAKRLASNYRMDRQTGQAQVLEVWCEAAGMAPQIGQVVDEYGVAVYSSGGFESLTEKYDAAARMALRDRLTVVLLIGDFDPSGLSRMVSFAEDVAALAAGLDCDPEPEFDTILLTREQVARYQLPGAPPKPKDKRGVWLDGEQTVQVEALPPDMLAAEVRRAVTPWIDLEALIEVQRQEDVEGERVAADVATLLADEE
jgi:hypothetical protein